jgi:hypothetical protein
LIGFSALRLKMRCIAISIMATLQQPKHTTPHGMCLTITEIA